MSLVTVVSENDYWGGLYSVLDYINSRDSKTFQFKIQWALYFQKYITYFIYPYGVNAVKIVFL